MGIISEKTERKALLEMAKTLRFFERLELLQISAGDIVRIAHAEHIIRDVIGNNGYGVRFSRKRGTGITKLNIR
ncbi:hypothetical protein [Pedobacter sp. KBW01]|uniref:hypothetical protein n=1 Tax=Pedobacter sp. KBW01 TaxID=2153364 RepID=UPI000F5AEEAD|nr:hypothetical protein [Pedobacter sp. KBW01]